MKNRLNIQYIVQNKFFSTNSVMYRPNFAFYLHAIIIFKTPKIRSLIITIIRIEGVYGKYFEITIKMFKKHVYNFKNYFAIRYCYSLLFKCLRTWYQFESIWVIFIVRFLWKLTIRFTINSNIFLNYNNNYLQS